MGEHARGDDDMTWNRPETELPPAFLTVLERELLALGVDEFWERADAIAGLLPEEGLSADKRADRRRRGEAVLSAELLAALDALLARDGAPTSALRDLLDDWDGLRTDVEKLVGHLLLVHGEPPATVLDAEHDALVARHAALHAETSG